MRIQHNIPALNTFRQLGINNTGSAKSLEKLSSGYRINRAGDDAAGLAISEKMRAQVRGLNRASANAQDGISLIQAAEGALQETHSVLQRMRELAVQAANDTNELSDRQAIQDELNQLKTEVDRIATTTEFNKKTLLDGSLKGGLYATQMLSGSAVRAGAYLDPNFAAAKAAEGEPVTGVYNISLEADKVGVIATDTFTFDLTGMLEGETIDIKVTFANADLRAGGQTMEDAAVFTYKAVGDGAIDNASFINGLKEVLQKTVTDYTISTSGNTITFTATGIGTGWSNVTLEPTYVDSLGGEIANDSSDGAISIEGVDAELVVTFTDTNGVSNTFDVSTAPDMLQYQNGIFSDIAEGASGFVFEMVDLTSPGSTIFRVVEGRDLTLQAGANTGRHQTIDIGVRSISAASLGIDNLRVDNHVASQAAIAAVENAVTLVSTQRSGLGAVQNRLEHTIANLDTVAENLQDAESRIRDVDMAKEMMNFTKFSILMQASQAMMAQANSLPQGVLQLLR